METKTYQGKETSRPGFNQSVQYWVKRTGLEMNRTLLLYNGNVLNILSNKDAYICSICKVKSAYGTAEISYGVGPPLNQLTTYGAQN